jgi:Heterokaryon incompatibility protein (HET)
MDPLASINPYASLKEEPRLRQVYQTIPAGSTRFLRYKKQISDETGAPKPLLYFELEIHNIEENWPQYSALSYTWGHPLLDDFKDDFADAIICNGQRIPVGFNLHEALQYFFVHSSVAPELLWVDAICIYSHRTRIKCCRNMSFEPLFCEGFDFTRLVCCFLEPERAPATLCLLPLHI